MFLQAQIALPRWPETEQIPLRFELKPMLPPRGSANEISMRSDDDWEDNGVTDAPIDVPDDPNEEYQDNDGEYSNNNAGFDDGDDAGLEDEAEIDEE